MKTPTFIFLLFGAVLLTGCKTNISMDNLDQGNKDADIQIEIPATFTGAMESDPLTVNGNAVELSGKRLVVWDVIADVTLDKSADYFDQVATGKVSDYTGYKLIHTVPSLDTPVCTKQTKELEATAKLFPNTPILIISNDTPFALKRFCLTNDISNVQVFSDARTREFGIQNGLFLPQYGLLTRSIMIVDQDMKVVYIDYEEEITHELDIANALGQLNALVNPPLQ